DGTPRSRSLGYRDHNSFHVPDGHGCHTARVGTGSETTTHGNDPITTGGASSCAMTAIHQTSPNGSTNRVGHPAAHDAGPQYAHLEESVVQAARLGGEIRGVVRIDPRA